MKKIFKGLALGMALTAAAVAPSYAQDDPCAPIYQKFTDNYRGSAEQKKVAIAAGDELIAKCSADERYKDPIAFVNKQLPKLKAADDYAKAIKTFEESIKDPKNLNADAAFASGKSILAANPELVDVMIALASVGFDKAAANPPVDKFNADAVNYAKQAIQKIDAGAKTDLYGVYGYNTKKEGADKKVDHAASKENTRSWMNYYIGYIMYSRQNNKKEALPYLYKATQFNVGVKTLPAPYQLIGDFYKEEFNRIDDERTKLAAEAKALPDDDPKKKELVDKAKELLALQKGYAERMIDAYARARSNAGTDQAYKDALYNTMKVLYEVRFDGKKDGLDPYITSTISKPMPDPTSPVAPIAETTTTTTTSSTTPSTTTLPTVTTPATTKPSNGTTTATTATTVKPSTTGATTKATTNGAATKTTPAKKPVAKKKGTR